MLSVPRVLLVGSTRLFDLPMLGRIEVRFLDIALGACWRWVCHVTCSVDAQRRMILVTGGFENNNSGTWISKSSLGIDSIVLIDPEPGNFTGAFLMVAHAEEYCSNGC